MPIFLLKSGERRINFLERIHASTDLIYHRTIPIHLLYEKKLSSKYNF